MENKIFIKELKRTCYCGELRVLHAEKEVVLMGWVKKIRDHGGLIFLDLRDKTGYVQVVFNPQEKGMDKLASLSLESVLAVQGSVRLRPDKKENTKNPTGKVEVEAFRYEIISHAQQVPFPIDNENVSEHITLKYRYLNLRSSFLQKKLQLAHEVYQEVRSFLSQNRFLEINTPILYKTTPEGARDYLVPSRLHPGSFYALTQSPQTLKQLLMVSGLDRYFQLAKCFRDEDLRSDRQPEFSQIDMEMSFVSQEDVIAINTELVKVLWKKFKNQNVESIPFLNYRQAMEAYGTDRPDLRNPLKAQDISSLVKGMGYKVFDSLLEQGGKIKAIRLPHQENFSGSRIKKWIQSIKAKGLGGLSWIRLLKEGKTDSSLKKFLSVEVIKKITVNLKAQENDIVFILGGSSTELYSVLNWFITALGKAENLLQNHRDCFLWMKEFPLLEYDSIHKRWKACHHPFTAPVEEDIPALLNGQQGEIFIRAQAYDLVCNGHELAGGSIRIHDEKTQSLVFKALAFSEEEKHRKFGFFLEALRYGTPPHGGIAWGLERLLMLLSGTDNIRDVMAFPKTTSAMCLMSSAPSPADTEQLLDLSLQLIQKESGSDK